MTCFFAFNAASTIGGMQVIGQADADGMDLLDRRRVPRPTRIRGAARIRYMIFLRSGNQIGDGHHLEAAAGIQIAAGMLSARPARAPEFLLVSLPPWSPFNDTASYTADTPRAGGPASSIYNSA